MKAPTLPLHLLIVLLLTGPTAAAPVDYCAALDHVADQLRADVKPATPSISWQIVLSEDAEAGGATSEAWGKIAVSPGLMRALWRDEGDDALIAAVIAHEMGHIQLSHHRQSAEAWARGLRGMDWKAFRREREFEADIYAYSVLDRAKYPPSAMAQSLARILQADLARGDGAPTPHWVALDHPTLVERHNRLQDCGAAAEGTGKLFNFALLSMQLGRTELALRCFQRLSDELSGSPEVWHNLGLCEHLLYLHKASPAALGELRPSLCPLYLLSRPKEPVELTHLRAAIEHYRKALALDPEQSLTRSHLAVALCYLDDAGALAEAQAAVAVRGAGPNEFANLGFVLQRAGRLEQAVMAYDTACSRAKPEHIHDAAVYNRALAREGLRQTKAATGDFILFLGRNRRGRWAQIAAKHLQSLMAQELGTAGAENWVATSFPPVSAPEPPALPAGLALWQSSSQVIGLLGEPDEVRRYPNQDGKLLCYERPQVRLLLDRDALVAAEVRGAAAEDWLRSRIAGLGEDAEAALRKALGPPDARHTEDDGSGWLAYATAGLTLWLTPPQGAGRKLRSCTVASPGDVFLDG